ncbi:MAG: hypothetical protein VX269_08700 [Verrucomicrobiota bacterium]|nr:hypothetical protein [Verrucomicrobiota bacterium]MEE3177417.1 hypothetical protein [Verrucomicrobiota bacterium]
MSIFSSIQDYQDGLVSRFCNPKRLLIAETDWYREESDIDVIKGDCCERILFFEKREFYLFHEPHLERMRVRLTFKLSETNAS